MVYEREREIRVRDLAEHPILKEFRDDTKKRLDALEGKIEDVDDKVNKILWSVAGGSAVVFFMVGIWQVLIAPILARLAAGSP